MTTAPAQPPRDRALGRGLEALIPSSSASSADVATALVALLRTVEVPTGLLEAAAAALDAAVAGPLDDRGRESAAAVTELLRKAVDEAPGC
ncbi:hypothetical protein [Streptomyces griseocarneus]|uniref:hypothetical protein n=1 Tax=Streptomyces griseocarneus TaxID=51201 RepID=UPI00167D1E5E|nr:hypothetical protein [Streptomyces griseocarneus]MBZ6477974.1 hypothetical protein [Streptomyces griseocarneus]